MVGVRMKKCVGKKLYSVYGKPYFVGFSATAYTIRGLTDVVSVTKFSSLNATMLAGTEYRLTVNIDEYNLKST